MNTTEQLQTLQNFADKFGLTTSVFYYEDKRKATKFIFSKSGCSVGNPFTYNEANCFLLGINSCKKYEI